MTSYGGIKLRHFSGGDDYNHHRQNNPYEHRNAVLDALVDDDDGDDDGDEDHDKEEEQFDSAGEESGGVDERLGGGQTLRLEEILEHNVGRAGSDESESYEVSFRPVPVISSLTSSSKSGSGDDGKTFVLATRTSNGDFQRRQQLLNRNKSLLEVEEPTTATNAMTIKNAEDNDVDTWNAQKTYPAFHPALKAAVYAEGQEVVWTEEQYSDVTSVVLKKPPPPTKVVEIVNDHTVPSPPPTKAVDSLKVVPVVAAKPSRKKATKKQKDAKNGRRKSLLQSFRLPKKMLGRGGDEVQLSRENPQTAVVQPPVVQPPVMKDVTINTTNTCHGHGRDDDDDDDDDDNSSTVKIHVKKMKVKKSVVLLPQNSALVGSGVVVSEMTNTDIPTEKCLIQANEVDDAAAHMVKARNFLIEALSMEQSVFEMNSVTPSASFETVKKHSEDMARLAFAHAATARKLAASTVPASQHVKHTKLSEPDLDEVLSCLAEKGQDAVKQHYRTIFTTISSNGGSVVEATSADRDTSNHNDDNQDIGTTPKSEKEATQGSSHKDNRKVFYSEYASRAKQILEAILPKENSADRQDILQATLSYDYWSETGMSTLGMNNDTFEYGLDTPDAAGREKMLQQIIPSKGKINMDLMSITSLNEILDGPIIEDGRAVDGVKSSMFSPRMVLPVIDVPQRRKSSKSNNHHPTPKRRGLLGLMSPLSTTSSLRGDRLGRQCNTGIFRSIPENESVSGTSRATETSAVDHPAEKEAVGNILFVTEEEFLEKARKNSETTKTEVPSTNLGSPGASSVTSGLIDKYKNVPSTKVQHRVSNTVVEEIEKEKMITELKESSEFPDQQVHEKREASVCSLNDTPNDDWDGGYNPAARGASKINVCATTACPARVEPVGKTPRFGPIAPTPMPRHEVEVHGTTTSSNNELENDSSPISNHSNASRNVSENDHTNNTTRSPTGSSRTIPNHRGQKIKLLSSPASSRTSSAGKSIGSKTQIFGRIADMMGRKRDPLIPTGVIEQTYIVRKHEVRSHVDGYSKSLSYPSHPIASQPADKVSMLADDSMTVIEQAIAHGLEKANLSNELDDDAPANYLEIMLRRKVKEERRKERQQQHDMDQNPNIFAGNDNHSVTDSYVEKIAGKIKGGRHQEVPGIYFEEIGQVREVPKSRDPDDNESTLRVLAPTPRRSMIDSDKKKDDDSHQDPPLDKDLQRAEARDRQRMITERLYGSTSSSFDQNQPAGKDQHKSKQDPLEVQNSIKPDAGQDLELAPTVETAESDEAAQSHTIGATTGEASREASNQDAAAVDDDHDDLSQKKMKKIGGGILGRSRRISRSILLPGIHVRKLNS